MSTLPTAQHRAQYLSVSRAADYLGCSRWTVQQHIARGNLDAVDISTQLGGPRRSLRISRASLEALAARRKVA